MKQEYIDYINKLGQQNVPFLFVIFATVNISILKIKADIRSKYHYNDR